jgi:hypothetical protein
MLERLSFALPEISRVSGRECVHPEAKARVLAWLCAQIGKDLYEAVTAVSIQGR